jgi:transcriptional regulator with XRE-family HTH domain
MARMAPPDTYRTPWRRRAQPDPDVVAFGRELLATRRLRRLSQSALERRSGVDQTMISRIERGLVPNTPVRRLVMLAGGLDAALGFVERDPTQGRRSNR